MDVLRLVKIRLEPQLICPRADIAHSGKDRFFHHVSEIARQLQLARAFYDVRLDLQRRTAHACPGKARHKADLVALRHFIGQEAARPQEFFQVRGRNDQLPGRVIFYKAHRALAADGGKLPLKRPHAGLSRIAGDNLANGVVCEPDAGFCDTVLCELLGKKMPLRDLKLFFVRVGAQLNNLHAIE